MNRRTFVHRVAQGAIGLGALRQLACHSSTDSTDRSASAPAPQPGAVPTPERGRTDDVPFAALRDRYFLRTLELNPVVSTYLGGDGYSPSLTGINGRLRDISPSAVKAEIDFLRGIAGELEQLDPGRMSASAQIDRALIGAQVGFVLHQLADRAYHQRSVDSYVAEPFRGIDWQMQQMTAAPDGLGTDPEWADVVARTRAVAAYLATARTNLEAGRAAGNAPDHRMVKVDGIDSAAAAAEFFRTELPALAAKHLGSRRTARATLASLAEAGGTAAAAYAGFGRFLASAYDPRDRTDRYAAGEAEYTWRVKNCLRDDRSAEALYAYGAEQVAAYEDRMARVADELAGKAGLRVRIGSGSDAERRAGVRAVMDHLAKDAPRDDDELFAWYRSAAVRAVAYGREQRLFDVPADYRLDIVPTPAALRGTSGASYYPAPPFKRSGVGRFYLTPTGGDPGQLATQCRASVADTAVHEGFPGHDWNYKYMTQQAAGISNVRWLTPGAVEDSASMWEDSMATEGWGLYAEELMAEAAPGKPYGFYDAAEYLFMLQGLLLRAVRIRVDVGIHTGRMTFDEAVDYHAAHVSFLPDARRRKDPIGRAAFEDARQAIYRYSKWPTQAITYMLGKTAIADLRAELHRRTGAAFDEKRFHEDLMRMGSIPIAYFRDLLLARTRT
ncbi:MAG TPA: DUF885 domain-containing protein [Kofleriaceae bacterium]|nr:DUF885 domain-containing protein [Kofleriaceae bacterium]